MESLEKAYITPRSVLRPFHVISILQVALIQRFNVWSDCLKINFSSTADGTCMYRGSPFMTSQGAITATINNAHVA